MKKNRFSEYIKSFDFKNLFNELGWDNFDNNLPIAVNEDAFMLKGIVEKKGFVILHCPSLPNGKIPLSNIRKQIEAKVAKHYFEHLIIYSDQNQNHQIWQIAIKEENKPKQVREISWYSHQDTEILFQRLKNLLFTLDEEEQITIVDVKQRISENFAKNTDKVTKKFYTEFKKQHTVFLDFIQGIDDHIGDKENTNKQWYASLMLNRLMFCYFIQKKGFLNQDFNYLQNKLNESSEKTGKDNFYSFYRSFLLELFHDGLGKPEKHRHKHPIDLGKIPYLNGCLFDVHELEQQFAEINISDDAFTKLFGFFDQWNWHLDNSIEATGRDINPDVIGYIFEKYINDRASMGAYYTKEDITDYIGKNTIIPFLFDETERHYKKGFDANSELWNSLSQSNDTYIYDAVKKGVPEGDLFDDLPDEIKAGFQPEFEKEIVQESTSPHLWETRKIWNTKAPENIALPTEIYRELIERRKRYAEIKSKIENGEINHINDFITYNLNIRQFTQDIIENTQDPEFIKAFFNAIKKITILDPTCGSGAFLFAALNILEPLYEACIQRIGFFIDEAKDENNYAHLPDQQKKSWQSINHKKSWFRQQLEEINPEQHPNLQYYIFKNIILNNLYGVDIMKEAVEIAKLRLFLKLVATVDVNPRKVNFGLEPLPDIDFNIRSGNTLIGFATEKELLTTIEKKDGLFAQDKLDFFNEELGNLNKFYRRFVEDQLKSESTYSDIRPAKAELNKRLNTLNHKLNVYLATNYGIDAALKPDKFQEWLTTHQPFHWFAEFYQIVADNGGPARPKQSGGGFDCIIGNPPYLEIKSVEKRYKIQGLFSHACGNLYAPIIERSYQICSLKSWFGVIVPISFVAAQRMKVLQEYIRKNTTYLYLSNFALRPASLFPGVMQRLTICLAKKGDSANVFTSEYITWYSDERSILFDNLSYLTADILKFKYSVPKISHKNGISALFKVLTVKAKYFSKNQFSGSQIIYYHNAGGYWIKTFRIRPYYKSLTDPNKTHTTISKLNFNNAKDALVYFAILNSNLFYFFWKSVTDARHLYPSDIALMPVGLPFQEYIVNSLGTISNELEKLMNENKKRIRYGNAEVDQYSIAPCKQLINRIDESLAIEYSFSEMELDFIINYDIKYRMGKELNNGEDEE